MEMDVYYGSNDRELANNNSLCFRALCDSVVKNHGDIEVTETHGVVKLVLAT